VTDLEAVRVAKNDATFRNANEKIARAAEGTDVEQVPFICECADERCTEIVRLTLAEYEHVRADGRRFMKAPGHEVNAVPHARVIERHDGYLVVEKVGEAAEIAEELDPREQAHQ
jgi:hypothetical protein